MDAVYNKERKKERKRQLLCDLVSQSVSQEEDEINEDSFRFATA